MNSLSLQQLPPPLDRFASYILLEEVDNADTYLVLVLALLICLTFVQLRLFARPPPVPLKRLPLRPSLSILFKPDDISATYKPQDTEQSSTHSRNLRSISSSFLMQASASVSSDKTNPSVTDAIKEVIPDSITPPATPQRQSSRAASADTASTDFVSVGEKSQPDPVEATIASTITPNQSSSSQDKPFLHSRDLPDSFAPLLSSSQTEILLHHLTADLIHGVQVEGGVRMQAGRHEIPLDKDSSRPQLMLHVPKGGCRLSAAAGIGSDRLSSAQDLDVTIPTSSRSCPMVKHAGLAFDPPLPLLNVAPTLIHFPTLFEDKLLPTLRRLQLFRFIMDMIISISAFLEKVLWIIESFLQIHLSKVRITPLYKGRSSVDDTSPEWRLSLAFSGHLLFCGWIPIPFINFILPTFIIPQPHALLEYLMTKQPLASARLRRENIAEQRIALALIETANTWNTTVKVVATPPAVGLDLTLPGGVSLGMELMHGRDASAGRSRKDVAEPKTQNIPFHATAAAKPQGPGSVNSMSSWTSNHESGNNLQPRMGVRAQSQPFDANDLVPWALEISAKGSISSDKMTFHLINCSLEHEDPSAPILTKSQILTLGSLAVWKADEKPDVNAHALVRRTNAFVHRAALAGTTEESPSVASILLFPDEKGSFRREARMLHYDYAFDVRDDSRIDAITLSVGASHPMLNGGSMVTTILESIYAYGSITARQEAVLDPTERRRKRNILHHLPAIDFTFGIQNSFIPPESFSYTDDGQTRSIPEMEGGRIMVRFLGGIEEAKDDSSNMLQTSEVISDESPVAEGIKVVADFGFSSITLNNETNVKEFPELDIFEGTKLRSLTSGKVGGSVKCYLRPQQSPSKISATGPNIFNPLEAYEIDFSGSSLSVKVKESSTSLGHRRVIIPTETTIMVKIIESIVDMSLEGKTQCELSWDFQGLSPILQVTELGRCPENEMHENKEQVSLLIAPLRQGRMNLHVSPVGGINITKAVTSREDKEGLYDWKFFNALVSPDEKSAERILQVLDDKRTMNKLLQVIKLVNADCHKFLRYALTNFWRAKEIMDQEGVSDPRHVIPAHKMASLMSLFLCGDSSQIDVLHTLINRVVAGDGLDVVKTKEILRQHCDWYDDWAPEIDRGVRLLETMFSPIAVPQPYVENHVSPLAELEHYASRFKNIPSAAQLYEQINDRPHLPLDPSFSNLVNRVAPYLSFRQIEYFLKVRASKDWQPYDLKRLRYVFSVKRKVLEIAESYGGLSFLPQSFLVSVFLGEATRASLRAPQEKTARNRGSSRLPHISISSKPSTLTSLRHRRSRLQDPYLREINEESTDGVSLTPAGRVASLTNFLAADPRAHVPAQLTLSNKPSTTEWAMEEAPQYELGDCLLGPTDVAILLQAGLTSVMKGSSVVQLNQRMLLDLVASQPKSFAVAVLAQIGTSGGQGSARGLTSALMALLELDQNSFRPVHRLDMHALLESWLPGLKVPKREDYMAGGRWARQSYYEAIFSLATSILEDAECYMALKDHIQRCRLHKESDPIPHPREDPDLQTIKEEGNGHSFVRSQGQSRKLKEAIALAKDTIDEADKHGKNVLKKLLSDEKVAKATSEYSEAIKKYSNAFEACARVRGLDKLAFHSPWFRAFYKRNYDALMIKSVYDNVVDDVDKVRYWLHCLRRGAKFGASQHPTSVEEEGSNSPNDDDRIFMEPNTHTEQALVDAIIDALIYLEKDRQQLRDDPLVRLLIPNRPGHYDFTIVTAMGVITDGKAGLELQPALDRLKVERGVETIRADTATVRSFEFNAGKIIEAIELASERNCPYGLVGYSQGCANALMAESMLLSGTPLQQKQVSDRKTGLVCRQLLFSAANGSIHGPASDKKAQRLIVMWEEFMKYQQGYFSKALQSTFLEGLNSVMDSAAFQKLMGGAQTFFRDSCRAFWRESQHLPHVPTCTLRGVLEGHTTPECLDMLSNMLRKQSGSELHDSQVHVYDAVGYPVYHNNRNGRILENCYAGNGAIQRTHHWSPLSEEVEFVATQRDEKMASFDCAKDRHIFPWVDVNVRFGFISYAEERKEGSEETSSDHVVCA